MSNGREYEIKFKARAADLGRFKRAVDDLSDAPVTWSAKRMTSRYFDTTDRRLAGRGVSLRIRLSDGKIVQTLKASGSGSGSGNGSGGLMDRREWEQPVAYSEIDLDALPADARTALGAVMTHELAPVMEMDMRRQAALIRRADPLGPELEVEVALDRGSVSAGAASERFAECELELKRGDVGAFFQLAAELNAACPLPLSGLTKSDRGYRLLDGGGPAVHFVPRFRITAKQTVHEALAEVFTTCIGNMVANEEACLDGADVEAVHQMRVSVRRLRSSLKIFKPYLDPDRCAWMADDLKWLGGALGPARDWDVYITETLGAMSGYGLDDGSIQALSRAAKTRRRKAYATVRETLGSERYARMMFRLTAFLALQAWLPNPVDADDPVFQPVGKIAAKALNGPYRKLMAQARGLADQEMEARHEVRIRLKKMRYGVDFLREVYPGATTKAFGKALRDLQDQFGRLNDVAQAMHLTDALTTPATGAKADRRLHFAAGQVRGWYARALLDAEPQLLRDWEAFAATPPFWKGKGK